VVAIPLAVCAALKLPQLPAGAHDHVTPPLMLLASVAAKFNTPPAGRDVEDGVTAMSDVTVTVAVPDFVVSLTEVAVIVTVPLGTVAGAV
jgi:hypothetical protein